MLTHKKGPFGPAKASREAGGVAHCGLHPRGPPPILILKASQRTPTVGCRGLPPRQNPVPWPPAGTECGAIAPVSITRSLGKCSLKDQWRVAPGHQNLRGLVNGLLEAGRQRQQQVGCGPFSLPTAVHRPVRTRRGEAEYCPG